MNSGTMSSSLHSPTSGQELDQTHHTDKSPAKHPARLCSTLPGHFDVNDGGPLLRRVGLRLLFLEPLAEERTDRGNADNNQLLGRNQEGEELGE
jgi:hypothetical protein